MKYFTSFYRDERILLVVFLVGFLSMFRALGHSLAYDELTYVDIAINMADGRYFLGNEPTSIAPTLPLIIAFFNFFVPLKMALVVSKFFCVLLALKGFDYFYRYCRLKHISKPLAGLIVTVSLVNPISIEFFGRFYPESIVFFSFWGFMYYLSSRHSFQNFFKALLFLSILVLSRYLFFVLSLIVAFDFFRHIREISNSSRYKLIAMALIAISPILFWGFFVIGVESNNELSFSYFDRFRDFDSLLVNIKAGLGLIVHPLGNRLNGPPAFISLFLPITGYRNLPLSLSLLFFIILGYVFADRRAEFKYLFYSVLLTMFGLVIAGTGFSRYWLVFLPAFYLAIVSFAHQLRLPEKWVYMLLRVVIFVYVINDVRLDYLYLSKFFS